MNEYDSGKMRDVLEAEHGMKSTDNPAEADILLVNTCSVREKAQERVFHDLGRVRGLKAAKPDLIIGVGGCVASQEGDGITERAPLRGCGMGRGRGRICSSTCPPAISSRPSVAR